LLIRDVKRVINAKLFPLLIGLPVVRAARSRRTANMKLKGNISVVGTFRIRFDVSLMWRTYFKAPGCLGGKQSRIC